jgi:hypothetical protein
MQLDKRINISDIPEDEGHSYGPIPEGFYEVQISSAEIKSTKAGNGKYIALGLTITSQEYTGRLVFTNINIQNPSEAAQAIGIKQLGSILRSCKMDSISDTDELLNKQLKVQVVIKTSEGYSPRNEVKKYMSANAVTYTPKAAAVYKAAAPRNATTPPWYSAPF